MGEDHPSMARDGILVLAASAGGGHMVAARAIQLALQKRRPDMDVDLLDVLAISNPMFRQIFAGGYLRLIRHAPSAMGWLYDLMDRPNGRVANALRVWIQDLNRLPTVRYVRQRRPRLIVNTHYLPAEIVAQMRRAGRIDCPQVTITTDFETHRIWVQEPTERYYTATDDGKVYLEACGAAPQKVRVTGIPVRPGFNPGVSREEARAQLGLTVERPVVLLLCGGFGVGPIGTLLHELITMSADAQVVAITGRNPRLRRRLERQAQSASRPVRVIGFTDQMHTWMQAADVLVSKPGGLTVSEALACGLPMVIVNPIPGQETRNSDYLLERGAAIKVNNAQLLGHRVGTLLADRERLGQIRARALRLARPDAADVIAEDALQLLAPAPS